tara:strand:+ start:245 stop:529 length:285 start_codon:yes stop_codon:yes gene_type:complete
MYNYRTGSTAGGFMGNAGGLNPSNIYGGPQQGQANPQLNPYMDEGYLPSMGMERQRNVGPMPGNQFAGSVGNIGGMGGAPMGQFNDPMTIKRVS